jgi:MoaA/NifB/PqqE/SkfB family radical SAM enzyme
MKLEDYPWMCPEPFTNINVTTTGRFRPCCIMASNGEEAPHFKDKIYNINEHTYKEFYNSDFMKRLRSAMKTGEDVEFLKDVCSVCEVQECSGNESRRQFYLKKFDKELSHRKKELEHIIENDSAPTFFHSMEMDGLGGNYCNLSCSMCHEYSSSGVMGDKIKLGEKITIPLKMVNDKPSPLIKSTPCEEFNLELPTLVQNLDELKLVGGEPLIIKEIYELMDMIKDPSKTNLRISTNGTIDPSKFIESAKRFKSVTVNVSIDGFGKVNDYIRYPSDWNTILRTYLQFRKTTNFRTSFVTTINALNIERLHEIAIRFPKKSYYFASYVGNNFYSINSIPDDIKKRNLEILNKHKHLDQVSILIRLLENCVYNEQEMKDMLEHIKRRDRLRGTNLLDVFPEWRPYYGL